MKKEKGKKKKERKREGERERERNQGKERQRKKRKVRKREREKADEKKALHQHPPCQQNTQFAVCIGCFFLLFVLFFVLLCFLFR